MDEETNINEEPKEPNRKMSEALRKIADEQENMRFTDGSKTQEILREGRDGGMFGE
ncbi:MAG TPA: hypothetical protein VGP58_03800 [Pyrinomonadaceae bacterium]|nr:hypothetical protein [Pyrinomonadaceae bacterium]